MTRQEEDRIVNRILTKVGLMVKGTVRREKKNQSKKKELLIAQLTKRRIKN